MDLNQTCRAYPHSTRTGTVTTICIPPFPLISFISAQTFIQFPIHINVVVILFHSLSTFIARITTRTLWIGSALLLLGRSLFTFCYTVPCIPPFGLEIQKPPDGTPNWFAFPLFAPPFSLGFVNHRLGPTITCLPPQILSTLSPDHDPLRLITPVQVVRPRLLLRSSMGAKNVQYPDPPDWKPYFDFYVASLRH